MSLVKRSGIYLGSNILNALVPFLLLPILTRHLSTAEYGQVAMLQTVVTGLAALIGLNTVGAANRKYYDNDRESFSLFNGACVQILFISILFVCLFAYTASDSLSNLLSIPESWIYYAIAISAANFIVQLRLGQWQVREQALKFGAFQVSQSALMFLISVLLVVVLNEGAKGRVDAQFITSLFYALVSVLLLYSNKLIKLLSFRIEYIREAFTYGLPLVPHVLGIFFLSSVDRFFINKQLGISEAGIYMFAVQLSLGVAVVFDAINKTLITWLFKNLAENKAKELKKVVQLTYMFFIIVLMLGLLSFIIGPIVVNVVGGEKFQRAGLVIGWLCLGQAFGGMYLMVTNYVFYAKRTGLLSVVTLSTGFINIVLLVILLKYFGIVGVAVAFAISMFLRFIGTWILAIKVSDFSWRISFN